MLHMSHILRLTLVLFAMMAAHPCQAAVQPASRFEPGACPIAVEAGERIDCGTLFVPENRARPGGRTIGLPVMIFRARSATPRPDPIVFLTGGPGNSAVAGRRSGRGNPYLEDRDHILIEPRGARHASTHLECPAINALKGEINAGRLRGAAANVRLATAARACRAGFAAAGVDLDGYTSAQTADDIEDLRRALGVRQWNLFALSYGTRLALTVLRRHPEGIRSLVLDSVLPPDVNFDESAGANLWRSLDLVFDGCAVDPACSRAFPDLRRRFASLVARAERRPLRLTVSESERTEIRGAEIAAALYAALHDPRAIPLIPRIVAEAEAGRYDGLLPLLRGNLGPSSFSWGLRLSVWCAEELPFEDPGRVAAQSAPALGLGGVDEGTASPEICAAWNVARAAEEDNRPVSSPVPVLIFAGEFDPDTPPDWGRSLLETMPNARFVQMPGLSHGASFNRCGAQVMLAFLDAPAERTLSLDCVTRMRGADFGLSVRAPS